MKVFISHASEDKEEVARPLASALRAAGIDVWFDEFVLQPGDSLRESIERGLAECNYGVAILSEAFFAKRWPQQELNGLFARAETSERRFIIPVWHHVTKERVTQFAPMLADRVALLSSLGIPAIAHNIISVLVGDEQRFRSAGRVLARHRYDHRYFDAPATVSKLGYELKFGGFIELISQLRPRELLIAYGSRAGVYEYAAHVTDEERMLEIERDWPSPATYYAVDVRKLLGRLDPPLPKDELQKLLEG